MQNFPSCVDVFKVTLQSEFDFLLGSTLASRRQRESAFFSAIEDLDVTLPAPVISQRLTPAFAATPTFALSLVRVLIDKGSLLCGRPRTRGVDSQAMSARERCVGRR
jgi:hypothetical protein